MLALPIERIHPSPLNPRRDFDAEKLGELADSIRELGIVQPVVVRPTGDGEYSLLAGERRYQAAKRVGLTAIPASIRAATSDEEAITLMLAENLQRADLNPMEEAEAFRRLKDLGLTQAEIARQVGKSQPRIAQSLKLLSLPEETRKRVSAGELSFAHARALSRFADRPELADRIAAAAVERGAGAKVLESANPFGLVGPATPNTRHPTPDTQSEMPNVPPIGHSAFDMPDSSWSIEECRAALARMRPRKELAAALLKLATEAILGKREAPPALSVWDAPDQEAAPALDLSSFDHLSVGPAASFSAGLLAAIMILLVAVALAWH